MPLDLTTCLQIDVQQIHGVSSQDHHIVEERYVGPDSATLCRTGA